MDIDKFSYSANLAAELAALELQAADKKAQLLRSLGVDLAKELVDESAAEAVHLLAKELVDDNGEPFEGFQDLSSFVSNNKEAITSSLAKERWYSSEEYAQHIEEYEEAVDY